MDCKIEASEIRECFGAYGFFPVSTGIQFLNFVQFSIGCILFGARIKNSHLVVPIMTLLPYCFEDNEHCINGSDKKLSRKMSHSRRKKGRQPKRLLYLILCVSIILYVGFERKIWISSIAWLSSLSFDHIPTKPCRVLVTNERDDPLPYLESIMAQIPLHGALPNDCNAGLLIFDFMLSNTPDSLLWEHHANEFFSRETHGFGGLGDRRIYGETYILGSNWNQSHHLRVNTSCACQDVEHAMEEKLNFCVLLESCPDYPNIASNRVAWLLPDRIRSIMPMVLPQFTRTRNLKPPYQLCILEEEVKTDSKVMKFFFTQSKRRDFILKTFGQVNVPSYPDMTIEKVPTENWEEYERKIVEECDAIISLLDNQDLPYINGDKLAPSFVHALGRELPIVGPAEMIQMYKPYNWANTHIQEHFSDQRSFASAVEDLLSFLDKDGCRITVDDRRFSSEGNVAILESIVSHFPADLLPQPSCNHALLRFDFILGDLRTSRSWSNYANTTMRTKNYGNGQERREIGKFYWASDFEAYKKERHDIHIYSHCPCEESVLKRWKQGRRLCIFHETCANATDIPGGFWLLPNVPRSIVPTELPKFDIAPRIPLPPYHVCVVTDGLFPTTNNLRSLILQNTRLNASVFDLDIIRNGEGSAPYFQDNIEPQQNGWDFVGYHKKLATTCDIMLSLVGFTQSKNPWSNPQDGVHSLTILKAAAYKIPIIVHENLFSKYKEYMKDNDVEIFSDSAESYGKALEKMIQRFEEGILPKSQREKKEEGETYIKKPNADATTDNSDQCHVVIDNLFYDQHLEVLESIMAKVPLDSLPPICDKIGVDVDFNLSPYPRSREWAVYANEFMRKQKYAGGLRRLGTVYSQAGNPPRSVPYAINVTATCKCLPEFVAALKDDASLVCMFHDACPELANHSRAFWFHPDQPHSYFPNIMPQFERESKVASPYRLCAIGEVKRRNYGMLERFLASSSRRDFTVTIMGKGDIPDFFDKYKVQANQSSPYSYVEYQRQVATGCDVILALVDRTKNGDYFTRSKMTGSVVQASAYKHPFVVHKDLVKVYGKYLKDQVVESHTDDPDTFAAALTTLLTRLDATFL